MPSASDLKDFLGNASAALAVLAALVGILAFLYRHPPAKQITFRQMRRHAKRLAPRIGRFHPSMVLCLSLRGAVVASILNRHLDLSIPVLVSMQYFAEDGVDPRIFRHYDGNGRAEFLSVIERPERCLFLPSEISCLAASAGWDGRILLFTAGDSDPMAKAARDRIVSIFGNEVVIDLTDLGKDIQSFPGMRSMSHLVQGVIEPHESDVILAIGLDTASLANHFAQYVLKRLQLHLPAVVCTEFTISDAELVELRRRFAAQVEAVQPVRPVSTNISHTYLPLDLSKWLPASAASGNVLLVDDYTASGSMLTKVKDAISRGAVTTGDDWRMASDRIATMTIAHRATDIPGRDRDNTITTFRGIPVRSLFRRSGREVSFPWPRH